MPNFSLVENGGKKADSVLRAPSKTPRRSFSLGVTGPPGADKSTLVDRPIESLRAKWLRAGVTAIDPTSPITGGALLGDRVRLLKHATDEGVFIRSMASRGVAGGLKGPSATSSRSWMQPGMTSCSSRLLEWDRLTPTW